jgi:hypothetical protein
MGGNNIDGGGGDILNVANVAITGAYTGATYNGVALTTGGSATDFLNAQGNYVAVGGGGGSLQDAYDFIPSGSIVTDAAGGDFALSGTEGFTANMGGNIAINTTANSSYNSQSHVFNTTAGPFSVSTAPGAGISLTAGTSGITNTTTGNYTVNTVDYTLTSSGNAAYTSQSHVFNTTAGPFSVSTAGGAGASISAGSSLSLSTATGNATLTATAGGVTVNALGGTALIQGSTQVLLNGVTNVQVDVSGIKTANFTPATTASLAANRVLADDGTGTGDLVYVDLPSGGGTIQILDHAPNVILNAADPGANGMITYTMTFAGARQVVLPAAPADGSRITIKEAANNAAPIAVTVSGGANIDFAAAYNIAIAGGSATFQYQAASNQYWVI